MVYSIGDSHSRFTFHDIDDVECRHLGPVTMYRITSDGLNFNEHDIPSGSTVITCFGEIDGRCHVQPQSIKRNIDIDEIIHELISNYINTLLINSNEYKIIVMSVVPPPYYETVTKNPEFPFIGNNSERSVIVKKLNNLLEEYCKNHNLFFLNVYDLYADNNGMLPAHLSDWKDGHGVHIKVTNKVKEYLKNNKII